MDKEVAVDHIVPAGQLRSFDDLPKFVEILFCEADNLQVLCHACHGRKTLNERNKAGETTIDIDDYSDDDSSG
jgi:hypothetical protein